MASGLKFIVFYGSVRPGRLCDRVGTFVVNRLQARGHEIVILDPKEIRLPLLEVPHHAQKNPPAELDRAKEIHGADGYVVVSAEYNHSIPPALTNLMSHFGGKTYKYRPGAIVTYSAGPWGGMRAAMQLRAFLAELGILTTSNILGIPVAQNLLDAQGTIVGEEEEKEWNARADVCFSQLEWVAQAVKEYKKTHTE